MLKRRPSLAEIGIKLQQQPMVHISLPRAVAASVVAQLATQLSMQDLAPVFIGVGALKETPEPRRAPAPKRKRR